MDRDAWNARYAARPLVWSAEPNRIVERELADLPPGRALDVGCGEGRNAIWLAARGWRVTAVDFSETAIEKARRLAADRGVDVEWVVGDVAAEPIEPNAYDLVLVAYLHTAPAERAEWMERARAALRPGGTFLYVGHDASNIAHGHGGPQDPEVLCSPADIVAALPGFRIERAEVVERPVTGEPGHGDAAGAGVESPVALDALVRAVKA